MTDPMPPLAERLRTYIEATDHVSFAELCNRFGDIKAPPGEGGELCKGENVVLWSGLTPAALDALIDLLESGAIYAAPTRLLVYLIDGITLDLPLMKRKPPKGGFKKPRWLPVVLRPAPRNAVA